MENEKIHPMMEKHKNPEVIKKEEKFLYKLVIKLFVKNIQLN